MESSCDDTCCSVYVDGVLCSNVVSSQLCNSAYGGVVPELCSRMHLRSIYDVVNSSLQTAWKNITSDPALALKVKGDNYRCLLRQITVLVYTNGTGLLGSLLVGSMYMKGLGIMLGKPVILCDHLMGHALSVYVHRGMPLALPYSGQNQPAVPFVSLLVSGGNSAIFLMEDVDEMTLVGTTIDDAVGELLDKTGKLLGLPYPSGKLIDEAAMRWKHRSPEQSSALPDFRFPMPKVGGYDFSFSGLKTSVLYTVRDMLRERGLSSVEELLAAEPDLRDALCYGVLNAAVGHLLQKVRKYVRENWDVRRYGRCRVALGGGVSASRFLREALQDAAKREHWDVYYPEMAFTTDNAAMVGLAGWYRWLKGERGQKKDALAVAPYAKSPRHGRFHGQK